MLKCYNCSTRNANLLSLISKCNASWKIVALSFIKIVIDRIYIAVFSVWMFTAFISLTSWLCINCIEGPCSSSVNYLHRIDNTVSKREQGIRKFTNADLNIHVYRYSENRISIPFNTIAYWTRQIQICVYHVNKCFFNTFLVIPLFFWV